MCCRTTAKSVFVVSSCFVPCGSRQGLFRAGVEAYLIDTIEDLPLDCLEGKSKIGLTSGASAPEHLVSEVIEVLTLNHNFNLAGDRKRTDEGISFRLPKGLR